ncbi:hypothetical protein K439DRAFT_1628247 [Ramaria rubella]|nr:hypothetical protein K439DRAFT_1628247 [Ramaria rubella]
MAPSASLQSRISAFENLEANGNGHPKQRGAVRLSPSTKPAQHQILDTESPTADSLFAIPPIQPSPSPSRPSSPPALGRKSSLIHFTELASPKPKPPTADGTGSTTSSLSPVDTSRKLQLPPRGTQQRPPLPPRKPSIPSLQAMSTATPPPLPKRHVSTPMLSVSKNPSNASLLNAPDSHTYPPLLTRGITSPSFQSRHMPSSSTSSFHSVSLSSDGGDTHDHDSLDGSYEAVSSTAATSPTMSTQYDWDHNSDLPKSHQRPWRKQGASPPIANPSPVASRRPPPLPPQRKLVNSNPQPVVLVHHRPAPLPPNVKKRYDALFERNLPPYTRKGRSSGWRGVSVDLLTSGDIPEFGDDVAREERLDGVIIKRIWTCSKLPRARLREIWNECDPTSVGSLDRDAFARGMWRIDEALKAHQQAQNSTSPLTPKPHLTSYTPRAPPPPLRQPSFPLR